MSADAAPVPATIEDRWMLESMLEGLPAILYFKDLEGRYVRVSENYLRVSGISDATSLVGKTDLETGMDAEQAQRITEQERQLLSGQVDGHDLEEHVVGRERAAWYRSSKQVVRDDDGRVVGTFGVALDITARVLAEEELRETSSRLERMNERLTGALAELADTQIELLQARKLEAIGQLAAGIAHEINTPIQFVADNTHFVGEAITDLLSVVGAAEELTANDDPADPAELLDAYRQRVADADLEYLRVELPLAIEQTIDGVHRVTEIVRALKDFAHPANHERTLIDLNRTIGVTATVSKNEWKHVAELHFEPDPQLPQISAIAGPLQQVLLILIVNAAQAIGGSRRDGLGTISVRTRHDDESVTIEIGDDGPGIPDEARDRIFEPFFTTKAVGEGSGQGLSIARSIIVKQHGGKLSVESEPGRGTTFSIRLPRA